LSPVIEKQATRAQFIASDRVGSSSIGDDLARVGFSSHFIVVRAQRKIAYALLEITKIAYKLNLPRNVS